jgi:hypothetical protein
MVATPSFCLTYIDPRRPAVNWTAACGVFGWDASVVWTHPTLTFPTCAPRKEQASTANGTDGGTEFISTNNHGEGAGNNRRVGVLLLGSGRLPPQPLASSAARASSRGRKICMAR